MGKRSYQEIKIIRLEKGESVLDTCYFGIFFFLQVLLSFQKIYNHLELKQSSLGLLYFHFVCVSLLRVLLCIRIFMLHGW